MTIELTDLEYRRLLDLVYVGNWVLNSARGTDRFEDYDYAIRMAAAGTKVTLKCYTRSNHGFLVHCTEEWEAGQELVIGAIRQAGL